MTSVQWYGVVTNHEERVTEIELEIWPKTPTDWAVGYTPGELS